MRSARGGALRKVADLSSSDGTESFLATIDGPWGFRRRVRVKRVRARDVEGAAALGREAKVYARLAHEAIPSVIDLHEADGYLTLVTDGFEGTTLEVVLEQARRRGERMPLAAIAYLGELLFGALDAAHTAVDRETREFAPVVHQGVNPTTLVIAPDGRLRLVDFGGSRTLSELDLTPASLLGRHEGYLAPEQILGDRPTVRTDVYSACLVLRELLTGAPTFPRGDLDYLRWLESIARPPASARRLDDEALPEQLRWLVAVGLRPDRDGRSLTAAAAREALRTLSERGAEALRAHLRAIGLAGEPESEETWPRAAREPEFVRVDDVEEEPTISLRRRSADESGRRAIAPALRARAQRLLWVDRTDPLPPATAEDAPKSASLPPLPPQILASERSTLEPTSTALALSPIPRRRALVAAPTQPSLRRQGRTPIVLVSLGALASLGGVVAGFTLGSARRLAAHVPRTSLEIRVPSPALENPETKGPTATPPKALAPLAEANSSAGFHGATLASPAELAVLLDAAGDPHRFELCFSSDDLPHSGRELRRRCAGGATFTLLSVRRWGGDVHRIGAYVTVSFELGTSFRRDERAFLFELDPLRIHRVRSAGTAVDNRNGVFGPAFGAGHDLYVAATLTEGATYPRSYFARGETGFAGGAGAFRVERLEVFRAAMP